MLRSKKVLLEKSFYNVYNPVIYLLQKTPLIGRIIPDSLYKVGVFKNLLIFLGSLVEIVKSLLYKLAYFFLVKFIVERALEFTEFEFSEKYFLSLLFILAISGTYKCIGYFDGNKEDYLMVKQIGMNPEYYYSNKIFTSIFLDLFAYTLVFSPLVKDYGLGYFDVFALACLLSASRIFFIFLFSKLSLIENKKRDWIYFYINLALFILPVLYMALTILLAYLMGEDYKMLELGFLTNRYMELAYILLLIFSVYKFFKTSIIRDLTRKTLRHDRVKVSVEDLQTQPYIIEVEDLEYNKEEISPKYKGINYINRIFFSRMNRPFAKSSRNRSLFVGISGLIILLIMFFTGIYKKAEFASYLENTMPLICFLSSLFIYMGDRFTRLCFFNMDRWLMKYSFYRRADLLSQSILIRFKYMIKYNFPILALLILVSLCQLFLVGASSRAYILTLGFSLLGMMFFNFHYLFMYYLFQPFTEGLKEKSFAYSILNILSYYIVANAFTAYSAMGDTFYYIVGGVSLAYIIIGFISVRLFAYKRFKLK